MADKQSRIEEEAERVLTPIVEDLGLYVYDMEYVREGEEMYLNAYIGKASGPVDIEDCEKVSRVYSDRLDEEDFIPDAYTLVVSSPGLGRKLKKDRHFFYSMGEEVEVKCFKPPLWAKEKVFIGILTSCDEGTIRLMVGDREEEVERKNIALARLTLDF